MRLIDADALKKTNTYALVNKKEEEYSISFAPMCCVLMEDVNNAPTIENRQKGKWIECRSSDHWKCDECGHPAPLESRDCEWLSNFCPNCGADMRKGGADNEKTDK